MEPCAGFAARWDPCMDQCTLLLTHAVAVQAGGGEGDTTLTLDAGPQLLHPGAHDRPQRHEARIVQLCVLAVVAALGRLEAAVLREVVVMGRDSVIACPHPGVG